MRAGRLRETIVIQRNTPTRSPAGDDEPAWTAFITTRAGVEPMTGREYLGSDQVQSETTHKFTIRYQAGITPAMRISWDSRLFDIQSVINVRELNKQIFIMTKERD